MAFVVKGNDMWKVPKVGEILKPNPQFVKQWEKNSLFNGSKNWWHIYVTQPLKVVSIKEDGPYYLITTQVKNGTIDWNVRKSDGTFHALPDGPIFFINATKTIKGCPLCGGVGEPMFNHFFCYNPSCRNYRREEILF